MIPTLYVILTVVFLQYAESQSEMCPDTGLDFMPHYTDCTKFFECDDGVKTVMSCPEEFVWSFWAKQCVYHDYISCFFTTIVPPVTTINPNEGCPSWGTSYLPDYGDCHYYYECDSGVKTLKQCPDGQAWSISSQSCDANADCSYTTSVPPTGGPAPGECPSSGNTYLPNYGDCTSFYICKEGARTTKNCHEGYSWNVNLEACDLTENVDCWYTTLNPNQTTTPKSTTTSYTSVMPSTTPEITTYNPNPPTTTTTSLGSTTTTIAPWTPNPICPYPSSEIIKFPYPYDCSMFYECVNGTRLKVSCMDGYLFSIVTNDCELADTVDCSYTTQMPALTTPMVLGNVCQGTPSGTLLPHPSNCKKYVFCENDISFIKMCALGTSWDQDAKACTRKNVACLKHFVK